MPTSCKLHRKDANTVLWNFFKLPLSIYFDLISIKFGWISHDIFYNAYVKKYIKTRVR